MALCKFTLSDILSKTGSPKSCRLFGVQRGSPKSCRLFGVRERRTKNVERCAPVSGFTLVEILVALALVAIALLIIVRLFSADLRGITVSQDYVAAVVKAESRMRELLADDALAEKDWSEVTDDGYRINASVKETLKEKADNLQVRMLDIGITVLWRKGPWDRWLTVRTLKVVKKEI